MRSAAELTVTAPIVRRVRVGDATVSIHFERSCDGSVRSVPPPQDAHADAQTFAEATKGWLLNHAPGRLATALRLALGEDHPE